MIVKESFEIVNELGMHARPSASFVKKACEFDSSIFVEYADCEVNGKSILGMMMLGAGKGSKIKVTADGKDAREAINSLGKLVANGFGE